MRIAAAEKKNLPELVTLGDLRGAFHNHTTASDGSNTLEDMAAAELSDGRRLTATGVLAEIQRLRQFANASGRLGDDRKVIPQLPSNKIEWLIDFMQERQDTGAKGGAGKSVRVPGACVGCSSTANTRSAAPMPSAPAW